MYRIAFLLLGLLFSFASQAQKIRFSDTSNKWIFMQMEKKYNRPIALYSIREQYDGDTVAGGQTYHRMLRYSGSSLFQPETLFIREDLGTGKVYQWVDSTEDIYMDYSWQAGDTIIYNSEYGKSYGKYRKVYAVDSQTVDGNVYKRFTIVGHGIGVFIEGIGRINHLNPGDNIEMVCFSTSGRFLFGSQGGCSDSALTIANAKATASEIVVYPQPAHDKVTIELPSTIADGRLQIRNIHGAKVYEQIVQNKSIISLDYALTSGVYQYIILDKTSGTNYKGKLLFE